MRLAWLLTNKHAPLSPSGTDTVRYTGQALSLLGGEFETV